MINNIDVTEAEIKQFFGVMSEFNNLSQDAINELPKDIANRVVYIKKFLLCVLKAVDVDTLSLNIEIAVDEFISEFALREELKEALHDADGEFFKRTMAQESLKELKEKIIRDLGDPMDTNHIKLD